MVLFSTFASLGLAVVKDILLRKRPWLDLFKPAFFFTYRHYLVVMVSGEEKMAFKECCGLVESRLRILVSSADNNAYVKLAHVNCHSYGKGPLDGDAAFVKKWFIGMEFDRNPISSNSSASTTSMNHPTQSCLASAPPPKLDIDLSGVVNTFESAIDRGMSVEAAQSTSVTVKYAKRSQLSQFLSPEDLEGIRKQAAACAAANNTN